MSKFGWSYPAGCEGTPYDEEYPCEVCGRLEGDCDCLECPKCGTVGDSKCYDLKHLPLPADSVGAFCDKVGIAPITQCLRAIDKYSAHHVWLVLAGPHPRTGVDRVYYHDKASLDFTPDWLRLRGIGLGGIAWDGSDWEFSIEGTTEEYHDGTLERAFDDALAQKEREHAFTV